MIRYPVYLLAYHTLNYVTACKVCNTPLKSNYFPIAGARGPQRDNPRHLRSEKPFLIYPLRRNQEDYSPRKRGAESLVFSKGLRLKDVTQEGFALSLDSAAALIPSLRLFVVTGKGGGST